MRRLRAVFSREVATVVIGYTLAVLLAVSFAEAFIGRQQAVDSLATARTNATRRIDQLQHKIDILQTRLRTVASRDARAQGRLEDAIQALAAQIRQMGGHPVTTGQPSPQPASSSPSPSRSPRPEPSHSPTPTPSPTCNLSDLIHDPTHCLHL